MEEWRSVTGYEGLYEVSSFGQVRSLNYNRTGQIRVLKPFKTKNGYYIVDLYKDGKRKKFLLHRLVYEAFNGKIPDGLVIDHCDGVKTTNNLSNLRCVTPKENNWNPVTRPKHVEANLKLHADPEFREKNAEATRKANNKSIVQIDKVTDQTIRKWECARDASRELGIDFRNISSCCLGKRQSAGGFKWRFAS